MFDVRFSCPWSDVSQGCGNRHTLPGFDQDAVLKDIQFSVVRGTVQEMLRRGEPCNTSSWKPGSLVKLTGGDSSLTQTSAPVNPERIAWSLLSWLIIRTKTPQESFAAPTGLGHRDSWCSSDHVSNTHSLRTYFTHDFLHSHHCPWLPILTTW